MSGMDGPLRLLQLLGSGFPEDNDYNCSGDEQYGQDADGYPEADAGKVYLDSQDFLLAASSYA